MTRVVVHLLILALFTVQAFGLDCPADYTKEEEFNSCYKIHKDRKETWQRAREVCQDEGTDLVIVDSGAYNEVLKRVVLEAMDDANHNEYWIGLNDRVKENLHYWLDDQEIIPKFKNFELNFENPDLFYDGGPDKDCTVYIADAMGFWRDLHCNTKHRFICGASGPTALSSPSPCKVYPVETALCTGNGWKMYPTDRTCIKMFNLKKTWKAARQVCKTARGDLVKIDNNPFKMFVKSMMKNKGYWIGLHDKSKDGKFHWLNEKSSIKHKKLLGKYKPNPKGTCVEMIKNKKGSWKLRPCSEKSYFICQKAAVSK